MNQETKTKRKKDSSTKNKRVCPICKTKKFRTTEDGLVCKYGHKVLDVQVEMEDETGFVGGRARKRTRVVEVEENIVPPAKRRSDHLLIIQFALRVVCRCMVQDLNFPPELETTVRELWLLFISNSKKELYEAYLFEASEMNETDVKKQEEKRLKLEEEEEELEETLHWSDSEEDDDDDKGETKDELKIDVKPKRQKTYPWPVPIYADTLVFIFLACVYLNYPILLNDLVRWTRDHIIPYLDMQDRIPSEFLFVDFAGSMSYVPSRYMLSIRVTAYYAAFLNKCNLQLPAENIPLFIERYCSQFYLPVQGYFYAEYLYKTFLKAPRNKKTDDATITFREQSLTTTKALACVIVAAKLIYAVNGSRYYSDCASEHNTTLSKEDWLKKIRENLERWKSSSKNKDDLSSIIPHLKQATVAYRQTASDVDKQNMIVSLFNEINDGVPQRSLSTSKEQDLFIKPEDIETTSDEVPQLIEEGRLYQKLSSNIKPQDQFDLLDLGTLIVGHSNRPIVAESVERLEEKIFLHTRIKKLFDKMLVEDYSEMYEDQLKHVYQKPPTWLDTKELKSYDRTA